MAVPAISEYVVRRFHPGDAASFLAAVRASLPGLAHEMPWCKQGYALADAAAWISFAQGAWSSGAEFPLGIFEAASGAVVGGTAGCAEAGRHGACHLH